MSDDTQTGEDQVESPTTENDAAVEIDGSGVVEDSPAEAQKPHDDENRVPQSRLNEVIRERNELREQLAALAETKPKEAEQKDDEPETPPDGLNQTQQVQWYVERFAKPFIERELGMSLSDAKTLLSTSAETSKDYATRQWEAVCKEHHVDPANKDVRDLVVKLCKGGEEDIGKAVALAAKVYGASAPNGEIKKTARVEDGSGAVGLGAVTDIIAKNAQEAAKLAKQGKRAKHEGLMEILERRRAGK